LAGKINQRQPYFGVERIERSLNDAGKPVRGSKVLLLGVAYKGGVADTRESPALKMVALLRGLGAEVSYHDPHVGALPELGLESAPLADSLASCDIAAVVTSHAEFDYEQIAATAPLVMDFRGVTRELAAGNIERL
jgi:UDP-N-acetyl-D-glucosamine dehydrogenase